VDIVDRYELQHTVYSRLCTSIFTFIYNADNDSHHIPLVLDCLQSYALSVRSPNIYVTRPYGPRSHAYCAARSPSITSPSRRRDVVAVDHIQIASKSIPCSSVKQCLFLPRDAVRKGHLCCRPVSVRLTVRLKLVHCIETAGDIVKLLSPCGTSL